MLMKIKHAKVVAQRYVLLVLLYLKIYFLQVIETDTDSIINFYRVTNCCDKRNYY